MGLGIIGHKLGGEGVDLLTRLDPGHELCIMEALKVGTLHAVNDAPRTLLLLLVEGKQLAFLTLLVGLEIRAHEAFGHNESHGLAVIEVVGLDGHIIDLRTYAQSHV